MTRLVLLTTLAACSSTTYERVQCVDNAQCRGAFGLGTMCGNDGFCEVPELHPRCTKTFPTDLTLPVDPATTLLYGSVFDHTLDTHIGRYQSAQLAAVQANANDGLEGRDIALIHCTNEVDVAFDDLDKGEASVATATWLADVVGIHAIVGPAASSRSEAVYNAVSEAFDVLVISPSATSPSLTAIDGLESTDADPGLFWRTAPPDDLQGLAIAADMRNTFDPAGITAYRLAPSSSVGVIHQTGAYGDGLQVAFTASFVDLGGTAQSFPFSDETSRGDAIAQAANGGFDEVLFVSSDSLDVIAFLQGAASLSALENTPLFLSDSARNADVLEASEAAASAIFPQIRGTAPANPAGPVYDSFQVGYAAEFAGNDVSALSFTAQSFDAMWLVIYGTAWAEYQRGGELTGTNIARGLRKVSSGNEIEMRPGNWNLVKAEFEAGDPIDVTGASGDLDYAADGETTATIDIWVINAARDGFDVVDSVDP